LTCSYRQSGSMIIFSIVSGHVETVCLMSNERNCYKIEFQEYTE
jgi:hypothetical protein